MKHNRVSWKQDIQNLCSLFNTNFYSFLLFHIECNEIVLPSKQKKKEKNMWTLRVCILALKLMKTHTQTSTWKSPQWNLIIALIIFFSLLSFHFFFFVFCCFRVLLTSSSSICCASAYSLSFFVFFFSLYYNLFFCVITAQNSSWFRFIFFSFSFSNFVFDSINARSRFFSFLFISFKF